jgi:hypothetical protein
VDEESKVFSITTFGAGMAKKVLKTLDNSGEI